MRIISGIYKSRVLISPDSNDIRPTSDRAKETLFNILINKLDFNGIKCLDLFCGTGNLGLESISRGAEKCSFVDKDTTNVQNNIEKFKANDKSSVYRSDAIEFLERNKKTIFDIIFCDPPYNYSDYGRLIENVKTYNTLFILEHSDKFFVDEVFLKFVLIRKKVGTVNFTLFDFKNIK